MRNCIRSTIWPKIADVAPVITKIDVELIGRAFLDTTIAPIATGTRAHVVVIACIAFIRRIQFICSTIPITAGVAPVLTKIEAELIGRALLDATTTTIAPIATGTRAHVVASTCIAWIVSVQYTCSAVWPIIADVAPVLTKIDAKLIGRALRPRCIYFRVVTPLS